LDDPAFPVLVDEGALDVEDVGVDVEEGGLVVAVGSDDVSLEGVADPVRMVSLGGTRV